VHIFIDESGNFAGIEGDVPAVSVQGALILETARLPKLFKKYEKVRLRLPKRNGEVKGSLLNEEQVAEVLDLLRRNGAIFCASMIDMSGHSKKDIADHRAKGIESLGANLTNGHTPELREGVADLQRRMASFSDPLYAQMRVTIDLLHRVMEEMIGYHCQRNPKELSEFHWVVDGKNPSLVTDWEDWWSNTLVVWLQAMSIERPGHFLETGDYRHFSRFFFDEVPDYLKPHVRPAPLGKPAGVNLQMMFGESFTFSSDPEPGLELVDIATNALRRALVGNLQPAGWLPLRALMIHRDDLYVKPVGFFADERQLPLVLARVLNRFRVGGRTMLTPSNLSPA
jgi:hypothetical protein